MIKEKALRLIWVNYQTKDLTWTIGLTMVAIIAPALLAHTPANQWITGTLVNATLFLAAWRLGLLNATLVATLPSSIALSRGLLPAPLALLIPYIIVSNLILMGAFIALQRKIKVAILVGALMKFFFLFVLTSLIFSQLSPTIRFMFSWPQLATALAGGMIALITINFVRK